MSIIIILFITAIATLFSGIFQSGKISRYVALAGLVVAFVAASYGDCPFFTRYNNMFLYDGHTKLFTQIALVVTFLIFLLGDFAFRLQKHFQQELYALMLFSLCGAIILFGYQNLVMLFLGIEVLSIPLYVLAGVNKNDLRSNEASLKYFLMGAFATGFLLFGIALVYGASGSFDINIISQYCEKPTDFNMIWVGVLMMLVGLLFKVSVVPFHFWSPDVYEGSPSLVATFMATVVKIAGFSALYNLITIAFLSFLPQIQNVLLVLAILTLIIPNIIGIWQDTSKRIMAYSSISHAGYLLLIFFNTDTGSEYRLAFYLLSYSIATVGVFTAITYVKRVYSDLSYIVTMNGLAKKEPIIALGATVSLLSMAGIPLTAGFIAKLALFTQAIETNLGLVIVAVIGSAISVFYYLKLIVAMYFKPMEKHLEEAEHAPKIYSVVSILVMAFLFIAGIFTHIFINYIQSYF